jgi:hypothetical protein|eukprot:COSAG06_NODE_7607_length_2443_cov_2.545648_2_plen_273_part_00
MTLRHASRGPPAPWAAHRLLLGIALRSGLAYDLDPSTRAHNHACIEWVDRAEVAAHAAAEPIEVAPGSRLCRTRADLEDGASAERAGWLLDGERDGACRGRAHYELAMQPAEAMLFWHRQNFNALPLPLMTWLGAARMGSAPEGVCRVEAQHGAGWQVGVLYGGGRDYAKCRLDDGALIEGNFDLIGAYNRSAPYLPVRRPATAMLHSSTCCRGRSAAGVRVRARPLAAHLLPVPHARARACLCVCTMVAAAARRSSALKARRGRERLASSG